MTRELMEEMVATQPQREGETAAACRFCETRLSRTFVDLGMSPLCETYPSSEDLLRGEMYYPLRVYVCEKCFLVQLPEYETPEAIFGNYAYFSSYSDSWVKHAEDYCESVVERFGLNQSNLVVEVASNDGYLLQHFVKRGIPAFGIEPAANVAEVAIQKGVPTEVLFFGAKVATELAGRRGSADLIAGNNVLAQVPDLNDFVEGLKLLLKPEGVITLEFPELRKLIEHGEFDTIYHEHFSYFSLLTTQKILAAHNLRVFDVEELATHGGSVRVFACHNNAKTHRSSPRVSLLMSAEEEAGLGSIDGYSGFGLRAKKVKFDLLQFLLRAASEGKSVAGYGAPGKSATLLHYCGITRDLLPYTVDRNEFKQGRFLPGTRIPIFAPERIRETRPDYVLILPWNIKSEIMRQLEFIREWGGRFAVPIPELEIC